MSHVFFVPLFPLYCFSLIKLIFLLYMLIPFIIVLYFYEFLNDSSNVCHIHLTLSDSTSDLYQLNSSGAQEHCCIQLLSLLPFCCHYCYTSSIYICYKPYNPLLQLLLCPSMSAREAEKRKESIYLYRYVNLLIYHLHFSSFVPKNSHCHLLSFPYSHAALLATTSSCQKSHFFMLQTQQHAYQFTQFFKLAKRKRLCNHAFFYSYIITITHALCSV